MMKKKFFFILSLFLFCKIYPLHDETINHYPLSLKIKIYIWDHYYQKVWHRLISRLSSEITQKIPDEIKLGQIIHTGLNGTVLNKEIERQLKEVCFGGIILFKANITTKEALVSLINEFQQKSQEFCKVPLFFSVDQEGGRVTRITDFVTEFPSAMAIGETNNISFAWYSGFITGHELSKIGIPLIFAPVADINNNPENPVINTRSFGTNKEIVSKMVRAYIEGINRTLAIGFLKHFPGHGDTNIDSHFHLPVISKTLQELNEMELVPFKEGIYAGAKGVMVAHILFPQLDELPATLSKNIITNILKKYINFQGLIITDAMEMKAVSEKYPIEKASYMSILAGVDMILLTAQNQNVYKIYKYLKELIHYDKELKNRIQEAVKKQIYFKLDTGLFDGEILRNYYKINQTDLELYKRLLKIKMEISDEIYHQIFLNQPDLSDRISYESIRSLYKEFRRLEANENVYKIFLLSKILLDEIEILKSELKNNKKIHVYSKNEFFKHIKTINENEVLILEIDNLEEWENLLKLNLSYKMLIALYNGNPFKTLQLSENQYIIASFSPTKKSLKSMIRKIFKDNIPASSLKLTSLEKNH